MTSPATRAVKTTPARLKATPRCTESNSAILSALWACIRFLSPLRDPRQDAVARNGRLCDQYVHSDFAARIAHAREAHPRIIIS